MSVIEIKHITKDYGKGRGVFDVSFSVEQGEVLGFLGPNGAGKTTTIRQLMGFIKPDSGSVSILGMDCFDRADEIEKSLGYLPGEIAFIDSLDGMEFIRFVAKMKKMKDLGRARELMDMFELEPSGKLKKMSKGMKQKIGIVCAFMQDAEILILDEPSSGLDPLMQNRFVELVLSEKKRGKTILMSSHMFEEIERTCDRAAIIRNGKLVAVEEIERLKEGRQKIVEVTFGTAEMARLFVRQIREDSHEEVSRGQISREEVSLGKASRVRAFCGEVSFREGDRTVTARVSKNMDGFVKTAAQFTVMDLEVRPQSLEEFFMHFYGEGTK